MGELSLWCGGCCGVVGGVVGGGCWVLGDVMVRW